MAAFVTAQAAEPDSREVRERLKQLRRYLASQLPAAQPPPFPSGSQRSRGSGAHHRREPRHAPPGPAEWAHDLSAAEQREWLVDCYRMRVDDEMVYTGDARGLYQQDGGECVAADFLVGVHIY